MYAFHDAAETVPQSQSSVRQPSCDSSGASYYRAHTTINLEGARIRIYPGGIHFTLMP